MMRLAKQGPRVGVGMKPARANEEVATCAKCGKKIKRKDFGHSVLVPSEDVAADGRGDFTPMKIRGMLCPKCAKGKRSVVRRIVDAVSGR